PVPISDLETNFEKMFDIIPGSTPGPEYLISTTASEFSFMTFTTIFSLETFIALSNKLTNTCSTFSLSACTHNLPSSSSSLTSSLLVAVIDGGLE
ncbi:MAG: hypothetical protein M3162_01285, partial [Thermoproteota archaeon]|nr:hypothetical protein [Thermoproteota archaeon]